MAMYDLFPEFLLSTEKKLDRHQRRVSDPDAQPEDREVSVNWLADQGTPHSLLALLSRFDMKLSQSLKDQNEKEFTYKRLIEKGEALERPLKSWLKQCRQVAIPLRMYEELKGKAAAIELVFDLLQKELSREDFKAEKKTALLIWLSETKHPRIVEVCAPALKDFDEGVRLAAAETLLFQNDEAAAPALLDAATNPTEESQRLRLRVYDAFAARRWPLGRAVELPPGYAVADGRVVKT